MESGWHGMKEASGTSSFRDPVCGMYVRSVSPHRHEHASHEYRFCGAGCLEKFRADPDRYLNKPEAASRQTGRRTVTQTAREAIYTCPMHPEVHPRGPGACPKCGMA